MDAFYVSVELRRRPELRGLPVIVAGTGPRAVVTTASYEARRFGVGSAIPAARARRLCPNGVYLPPDFAYYREASREVMALVRACADSVEVVGLDEAYLDLTGLPAPRAEMRRLALDIERRTGLGCSIGIGPNKLVAKVASDAEKPRGFVVLSSRQARERFADARCGLIPGIGPKTAERLRSHGLDTLGKLRRRAGAARSRRASVPDSAPSSSAARASRTTRRSRRSARSSPNRVRPRLTGTWRGWQDSSRSWRGWSSSCAPVSSARAAAGARSGSRYGSTTSPPTRELVRSPSRRLCRPRGPGRPGPAAALLAAAPGAAARGAGRRPGGRPARGRYELTCRSERGAAEERGLL